MSHNSFRWSPTHPTLPNVLKAHGYMDTNEPSDVMQAEADDFILEPGKWRWNGAAWVPFTSPPPTDAELQARMEKFLIATVLYFLDRENEVRAQPTAVFSVLTSAGARQGIVDKFKTLP